MSITTTELMEGVKLHKINTKKYKTNLLAIYLTSKLDRKHVTENALMLAILRRGTNKLKTQEDINIKLEELYGADFNCGIDKLCNDSVFKFYIESLNDEFLYEKENIEIVLTGVQLKKKCIDFRAMSDKILTRKSKRTAASL